MDMQTQDHVGTETKKGQGNGRTQSTCARLSRVQPTLGSLSETAQVVGLAWAEMTATTKVTEILSFTNTISDFFQVSFMYCKRKR